MTIYKSVNIQEQLIIHIYNYLILIIFVGTLDTFTKFP